MTMTSQDLAQDKQINDNDISRLSTGQTDK